jgi:RNA polymerase sigma factor (sigma-70 family)
MEAMGHAAGTELRGVILSAATGDEIAFARIVAAYHEDMRRVCVFVARDEALAEDAVQAAWTIAWRKLGSLREPERLRPWLVSVAVNEAKKSLKRRRQRAAVEVVTDLAHVPGGWDPATGIDSLDALAAMDRLHPEDRALLAMRYAAGFDATELSVAIGLSPSGTRTRLERLLARLRQELCDG